MIVALACCAWAGVGATSGCAVAMATRQPAAKDLSVLKPGHARSEVIATLGWPEHADEKEGHRVDRFDILQGYSKGAKVSRALGHGVADAMTLGLWEAIGTPAEMVFDGNNLLIEVAYDADERVVKAEVTKRK